MNEIEKLTQALRDNEDLSFGGIRTLKMIEDVYKKQLVGNVPEANVQPQLADVLEIVDGVLNTIPFYAYGDNEAAVRMIEALHKIRDKVLEHVG